MPANLLILYCKTYTMKRGAMEKHRMQHKLASKYDHKIVVSVFIAVLLVIGTSITLSQISRQQNSQSHAAGGDCTVTAAQLTIKAQEQTMFTVINQYRVANGKTALTWSAALKKPAAWLSADMLKSQNLSHTDSLGRTPDIRLPDCGFTITNSYGENIANGAPDPTQIVTSWEQSTEHNTILLDAAYTQAAIDMETNAAGTVAYYTMDLAGPTGTVNATLAPSSTITSTIAPTLANGTTTAPTLTNNPSVTLATQPSADPNAPSPTGPVSVDMQIAVRIKIAGIGSGGNIYPKHLSRHVQATVYGVGTTPVANGTAYLTYDGSNYFSGTIHLGKMSAGTYLIKLSSDNTLLSLAKPEFQTLSASQINTLPPVTLVQGDLTNDNVLDINDYNAALPCFQNQRCDTANNIDFNDDGVTNVTDYNLFLQSFLEAHGN